MRKSKFLITFAQKRLKAAPSLDFFAKFGEKQSAATRQAQARYLLGLGCLGKGNKAEAEAEFEKALEMNVNHIWAKHQLELLRSEQ